MAVAALSSNPQNFTENSHGSFVLEGLRVQKDMGRFCDITLYVDGKQFRAHRNVLASCSPYFEKLLKTQRIVKEHLTITCKSSDVFQCLLNYMYTGSVVIDKDNVEELVRLSNIFLVLKVKNYCAEYLERNIDTSNCLFTKDLADKYSLASLSKQASNFIRDNMTAVMKGKEILGMNISSLESFLTEEAWTVPQNLLLPLVTRWVRHDVKDREKHTRTLLTFIDWNAMESTSISEHVDRDPLYPASEMSLFAVLQALLANNLLFNKYQVVFDALRDKFSQVGYLGDEPNTSSTTCDSNVKTEASSPVPSPVACSPGQVIRNAPSPSSAGQSDAEELFEATMQDDSDDSSICEVPAKRAKKKRPNRRKEDTAENNASAVSIKDDPEVDDDSKAEDSSPEKDEDADPDYVDPSFTKSSKVSTRSSTNEKRRSKQSARLDTNIVTKTPLSAVKRGRPPGSGRRQRKRQIENDAEEETLEGDPNIPGADEANKESTFTCTECEFSCTYIKEYYRHLKEHFPGPPFKCDNCDYSSDKMINFLAHRSKTCDDKPHHCTVCDYKCRSRPYLLVHMRSHTGELKYKCETCGRAYAMRSTLEQHRTSHSKEQPYLCDACGFATKYIAHLMAHKRIHTGDVYKCSFPDCKYSTPKKSQLTCHARTHEGVRPHTCHICGRGFLEKSHLVRHERIHLEEKPFKCEHCDYASSRRDKLKEHYLRHHGESAPSRGSYRPRPSRQDEHGSDSKGSTGGDDYNMDNISSTHSSSHGTHPHNANVENANNMMMVAAQAQQDMASKFPSFAAALPHNEPHPLSHPHPHSHPHLHPSYQHHGGAHSPHHTHTVSVSANGNVAQDKPPQQGPHPLGPLHPSQIPQQLVAAGAARNHPASMAAMMLDSRFHHPTGMPNYNTNNGGQLNQQPGPLGSGQVPQQGAGEFSCMSLY